MLKIQDNYNKQDYHEFSLSKVEYKNNEWVYTLENKANGLPIVFVLPYSFSSFHDGNSVSVYLFKNKFFAQKDVVELRTNDLGDNNGRLGYIVQLNSIFDSSILTVHKHLFSYFYYTLGNIFFNTDFKQLKTPDLSKTTFDIDDFFDEDTLVLMLHDQTVAKIPEFNFDFYLPSLYKYGFYQVTSERKEHFENNSTEISTNYLGVSSSKNRSGISSLMLIKISKEVISEIFLLQVFKRHLLRKLDQETRFLILYQVVEILIYQILTLELKKKVCALGVSLEAHKLKRAINDELDEAGRITHLFHGYSNLDQTMKELLKKDIYDFLNLLGFQEYSIPYDSTKVQLHDVFYGFRNKLVHNHRYFKSATLNEGQVEATMKKINSMTELLIIDLILTYHV